MVYITGDIHGSIEPVYDLYVRHQPTPDDIIVLLGDTGINYTGKMRDRLMKQDLSEINVTLFCIHGNHEMRPGTLPCYHTEEWNGGQVYVEDAYPNLLFAIDGEVYDLGGIETLVIGGAYSIDKFYRLAYGYGWWPDEQPSPAIKEKVEQVLDAHEWKVDAVLSHTTPLKYEPVEMFLSGVDQSKVDKSTEEWLDTIEDRLDYKHWYCGHYHTDKKVDRLSIMFESVEEYTLQ